MERTSTQMRNTRETEIALELGLDGGGSSEIETGIGFFDHMLDAFARHGGFSLRVQCTGDLHVDGHHTVEDVGRTLGAAFDEALGGKEGITRFADATVPLDEALVRAVADLSGRAHLEFHVDLPPDQPRIGEFDAALAEEFWRGFVAEARLTLHLDGIRGGNAHHIIEATFKAAARALGAAARIDPRLGGEVPSTKGVL